MNTYDSQKKYNACLDFIKGLACIFVVWMHCEFPGNMGVVVQAISRFSVPLFFMVSGYFSYRRELIEKMDIRYRGLKKIVANRKVRHIAIITFWASLFYFAWVLLQLSIWHDVNLHISKSEIAVWLIFNEPAVIAKHLWFLFALLYDYILVSILDGTHAQRYQYWFGGLSLLLLFVFGQVIHLLGIRFPVPDFIRSFVSFPLPATVSVPNFLYRNWLVEGLAFFMLGRWIRENGDNIRIGNSMLMIVFIVSTLLCLVERRVMGRDFGVNLCTLPQVVSLFIYAIKNPDSHRGGVIQYIGKNCSMMVYILHIFVWQLLLRVYNKVDIYENVLFMYLLPVFVVFISIILAIAYNKVKYHLMDRREIPNNC